jgi:hypothetical protein
MQPELIATVQPSSQSPPYRSFVKKSKDPAQVCFTLKTVRIISDTDPFSLVSNFGKRIESGWMTKSV